MRTMQEILADVKSQLETNENGYGEPQAWIYLEEKDRSIEIVHEKEGMKEGQEFYSLRFHCNEEEFEEDKFNFNSMNGVIDMFCTESISDEQLIEGISYLMNVNLIL